MDPSDRKKRSDIRWQSANPFDLLVEAVESISDYGIFMLDSKGNILTWNLGAERIKGYSAQEAIGRHFSMFYTPEDLARNHPANELREAEKTGRYEEEGWRLRKDGSRFWANVVITRLTDPAGRVMGFSKVTRDLTQRKQLEEKLRESELRSRLMIEGMKDYAIFMLDPEGRITSWNEGAKRIKGYEEKEVLGKHFSIFYPLEEVRAGKCEYELNEALLTGRFEDEGWRVRKDGSLLWASVVITAVHDADRRLIGFSKVTRDLTERKRAEDRLRRGHANLEIKISERTAELASVNAALKAREAALEVAVKVRDEFLSVASHELKTPVTSLKMQLQMLRLKTDPAAGQIPPPERLVKSLDTSLRQIDRLSVLIDELLDVTRVQAQKMMFHFERLDLVPLVNDTIGRLSEQAEAAGCEVKCVGDTPVWGQFDRFRMEQVLSNLLTNAFKYAAGTKVEVSVGVSSGTAVLVVKDQGPGIPLEAQPRIFDRFERAAPSRNVSGLGLGLFISRQIVEGHRGRIRVESSPGAGAAFIVEIPVNMIQVNGGTP